MKSEWQRETRACPPLAFDDDLLAAIRELVEKRELGPVEAEALASWQTTSERPTRAGLFGRGGGPGGRSVREAVIVTPTRLVFAVAAGDDAPVAKTELLARLDVQDYETSPEAAMLSDHGVTVLGFHAGDGMAGSIFMGLGEGPDADHVRAALKDAARAAHGEAGAVRE